MLKPKTSQHSGCTHFHQRSQKRLNKHQHARKLMATVFWDRKGVLMVEFMQQGTITTSEDYYETQKKIYMGQAIQNKRCGML
jgi:hypothetical protein